MSQANIRTLWLLIVGAAAAAFMTLWPPVFQDQQYHSFADQRTLIGILHFWNTTSNVPFALVGVWALLRVRDIESRILFAGVLLTAFGSGYYHLAPDDARLVWDRLPMTVGFMALTASVIAKWVSPRLGRWLLVPLLIFGAGSVVWWKLGGDLRWYGVAQFGPLLIALPAAITSPAVRGLWPAMLFYALAKVAEAFDVQIATVVPLSGHTYKHLLAAIATYAIFRWTIDTAIPTETTTTAPTTLNQRKASVS